jgi:hypothetical protein
MQLVMILPLLASRWLVEDPSTALISFPYAMVNRSDNQLVPSTVNPEQVR